MQICRFNDNRLGLVEGDVVKDVTSALDALPAARYPLPTHDPLIAYLPKLREAIAAAAKSAKSLTLADLPPACKDVLAAPAPQVLQSKAN